MVNYTKNSQFEAYSSYRYAYDVTPSEDLLPIKTTGVMITEEGATVTGVLIGDTSPHTTHPLKVGVIYPFMFKRITAVSSGAVKIFGQANERIYE